MHPGIDSRVKQVSGHEDCYRMMNVLSLPGNRLGTGNSLRYNIPVKPSIFVVEDDPDISRLVRHHLENEGFVVRVYPTGSTVLGDAERQRPALFVLDIMVPGKDGLEICQTIRQTPGLASVPVIFLTAKSSEADRVLGLELGADDYIAKPFSPRELVARVKAVLRRAIPKDGVTPKVSRCNREKCAESLKPALMAASAPWSSARTDAPPMPSGTSSTSGRCATRPSGCRRSLPTLRSRRSTS